MVTETHKYFQPDPNLSATYGGAAIVTSAGSDINPYTATQRRICQGVNLIGSGCRYVCRMGQDGSSNWWFKVSDNLYPAISSYLTATELGTVTSTAPSGFSDRTTQAEYQPHPDKINITVMGDSLSTGVGTTSGASDDAVWGQWLESVDTNVIFNSNKREGYGNAYAVNNIGNGSSSWGNTVASFNTFTYREDLRYNQQTKTLPFTYGNHIFIYWLGTNDLDYDTGLSAVDCYARISARISAFTTDHPNAKLIICTPIRRTEDATLNGRIEDLRTQINTNAVTDGAHVVCDFGAVTELNPTNGDTTNTTYYSGDQIHLTTAGQALLVSTANAAILAAKALL